MKISSTLIVSLGSALVFFAAINCGCGVEAMRGLQVQNALRYGALPQAQIGNSSKTQYWIAHAIAEDPHNPDIYAMDPEEQQPDQLTISNVYEEVGDYPSLTSTLKQAQKEFPTNVWILVPLADAQGRLGDVAGMRATSKEIVALVSGQVAMPGKIPSEELMMTLAQAYCDSGDVLKGFALYQKVIETNPLDPEPLNSYAYEVAVANNKSLMPQALADAVKALGMVVAKTDMPDQQIGEIRDTVGWLQYRTGDYKAALLSLIHAAMECPRESEIHYHLAMAYMSVGDPESARIELTHATLLGKGFADAIKASDTLERLPSSLSTPQSHV